MRRKEKFVQGEIFHVFNKSIANFEILSDLRNAQRFIEVLDYYNNIKTKLSFSRFVIIHKKYEYENILFLKELPLLKFIAYCIMPDHYHLLVKIIKKNTFSNYVSKIENSFTRYFNLRFARKGPLWQSEFRAIRIKTDEQLLHVSRYIHLNPTTSNLVQNPEDWVFSSYRDYIADEKILKDTVIEISIKSKSYYQKFVEDRKDYQRRLKQIKTLLID
jgi:putative transposase